jgi:hypothetical protein
MAGASGNVCSLGTLAFLIWVVAAVLLFPIWSRRDGGPGRAAALGLLLLGLAGATAVAILGAGQTGPGETGPASGSEVPLTSANPAAGSGGPPSGLPSAGASPASGLIFTRYEVVVDEGAYEIFRVDALGTVTARRSAVFGRRSGAAVDRVVAASGLLHWRTIAGYYAGWSYIPNRSGPFTARAVFTDVDGGLHYANLGQTGK